ncbi:MAG TPA: magnesium transporter [Humisphaera sp.]|jgi:magnesium transporter|nr:magnesium transporter [Humisphaera sp.]
METSTVGTLVSPELQSLIREKKWSELKEALADLHPADVADVLIEVPDEDDAAIFRLLPSEMASAVFSYLPRDHQQGLIHTLSHDQMRGLLAGMTPDDQVRLLDELPGKVTRKIIDSLSPDELPAARELLGYPVGTAGRYMTPQYVRIKPEMTAREALQHIRKFGQGKETLSVVYIVDKDGRLVEDVKLGSLVLADDETLVKDIQDSPLVSVKATDARDDVIATFQKYDRNALPVTDKDGKMMGIITADDVLDAAQRRATEDIQKIGGSEALDAPYLDVDFWQMCKKRGGWLAALFLGETLTATAMGHFEHEIEKAAVVALFVPLIISSGGNSGSQATSIIIRSLALREMGLNAWFKVLGKELVSGLALGTFLGFVGFCRILLWYFLGWHLYDGHPYLMGFTVWASLIGVVMFGSVVGSMLPFLLRKIGFDPATASAPFVATLVDVTGLIIYFTVAMLILRGTLL